MITTVLFDLDGTLLPMDLDLLLKDYMTGMAAKLAIHGYEPKKLISTIWKGTAAMAANDGSKTNEDVLWDLFAAEFGEDARKDIPYFEDYYQNEFQELRSICGYDPRAAETVRQLKEMGLRVALATNPLFPAISTQSRIRWAGLEPEDFELITTYENSRHSKPNPAYYADVLKTLGISSDECIMVGNDAVEDLAAAKTGIPVFLLTDCLINKTNVDISQYPHGSFPELMDYIRGLNR